MKAKNKHFFGRKHLESLKNKDVILTSLFNFQPIIHCAICLKIPSGASQLNFHLKSDFHKKNVEKYEKYKYQNNPEDTVQILNNEFMISKYIFQIIFGKNQIYNLLWRL